MAWPSGTKASTQYTDSPQDQIALARAEINQTISNVNDIIDTFDIASPNDGDVLEYDSGTGSWKSVSKQNLFPLPATFSSSIGAGGDYIPKIELVSGNTYRRAITGLNDLDSVVTDVNDSAGQGFTFTLPAGTYKVRWLTNVVGTDQFANPIIYNETAASNVLSQSFNEIGTTGTMIGLENSVGIIIGSTNVFSVRQTVVTPSATNLAGGIRFEIQKHR